MVPAGAEDITGRVLQCGVDYSLDSVSQTTKFLQFSYNAQGGHQTQPVYSSTTLDSQVFSMFPFQFRFYEINQSIQGSVGLYLTWYFESDFVGTFSSPSVTDFSSSVRLNTLDGTYEDISTSSQLKHSRFAVYPTDGSSVSSGVLLKGRFNVDSIVSLSSIFINSGRISSSVPDYSITKPAGTPGSVNLVIPSVVFLTGAASDLDALEGIADSIAAQSEIMSAMYADIMSLLNDLYARLGDMQAVEELTNTYFAQLIPLVNSINTNTANIYSLLQTQFQLLRTLIATESDDIQAAIQQQTEDLKAYFDSVFSGSVGDMPEKSDDLDSAVGDFSSAEQDYQSNATQRFDELVASFNGFTGGTLAGITLASTLFKRVWDALGEYNIVYTYPLLLGLSLLLIGRLSRLSGGQSSAEKHRGDSDA